MLALLALSDAIEARDPYTCGHSARVARMAHELGTRLGCNETELLLRQLGGRPPRCPRMATGRAPRLGCNETELLLLQLGGALHDVGKLVISQEILRKP